VTGRERIVAALDVPDPDAAARLAGKLAGHVGMFKVGLELFVAHGRAAIEAVRPFGVPVFLDLKLHDIPQTVEAAARAAGALGAAYVTVHASGGAAMVSAARNGLVAGAQKAGLPAPKLLAVTVLTSLGADDVASVGFSDSPAQAALRLARLAMRAGADGIVCSPEEVADIRRELGAEPLLVVPGIRPEGMSVGDQRRTGTPHGTITAGATHIVVGRPLRDAPDPAAAADAIAASIDAR
jgi:orotidine-5'-phosphate decarboxylase